MRRELLALVVSGQAACAHPGIAARDKYSGQALAVAAVAAGPWINAASTWGPLCPPSAPCDTVILDPRVAHAPRARRTTWLPDHDPTLFVLTGTGATRAAGPVVALGSWQSCNAASTRTGPKGVRACAALAFPDSIDGSSDSLLVVMVATTPAQGMSWSQIVLRKQPNGQWAGRLAKFWAE